MRLVDGGQNESWMWARVKAKRAVRVRSSRGATTQTTTTTQPDMETYDDFIQWQVFRVSVENHISHKILPNSKIKSNGF